MCIRDRFWNKTKCRRFFKLTFSIIIWIITAQEGYRGNSHPSKTNVYLGFGWHWFSRGDNFPCYPLVHAVNIYIIVILLWLWKLASYYLIILVSDVKFENTFFFLNDRYRIYLVLALGVCIILYIVLFVYFILCMICVPATE